VADLAFENDVEALLMLRRLYNYLPLNNREKAPVRKSGDPADRMDMSLDTLVPDNPNKAYDMKELIVKTVDDGDFFELQPEYAKNIMIGFAAWKARRLASWPISRWCWPVAWTSRAASRRRVLCVFVMRSTSRSSPLWTCPASCPARAGVRRHHQARRQAAVCLRRVHGAQDHGHHAQGLWRRV
jgi:hypothetical protein